MQTVPGQQPRELQRLLGPTISDWLAIPEERRAELVDGRIVYQAMLGPAHGRTQGDAFAFVRGPYDRRRRSPGGWWISLEVDVLARARCGGHGCPR